MKTKIKVLSLLLLACVSINNAHANCLNDSTDVQTINLKPKGDGHFGDKHGPHRIPANLSALLNVCYNADSNELTFSASDNISFTYDVLDNAEIIICSGTLNMDDNCPEIIVELPYRSPLESTLEITINGHTYIGYFETE